MKCNSCGFNTFDYLDKCNKCGGIFKSNSKFKHLYKNSVNNRSKIRNLKLEGLDKKCIDIEAKIKMVNSIKKRLVVPENKPCLTADIYGVFFSTE